MEVRTDIGFAKDNDGNLIKEYPMKAFGEMVILENRSKTTNPHSVTQEDGFFYQSDNLEHEQLGGWTVVAVGELVKRVEPGDIVGNPIGSSPTVVMHPYIAHRVEIEDQFGNMVTATKEHLDYVYVVVNQQLIGMQYL